MVDTVLSVIVTVTMNVPITVIGGLYVMTSPLSVTQVGCPVSEAVIAKK